MTEQKNIPRILVVEDDPDQRALIIEALVMHYNAPEGLQHISGAGSGSEALAMDLSKFDIILQDYNLPDMNGLDLLKGILSRWDVPVILVTGENTTQTAAEAIRCGAQDYVVKLGDYLFALPILVDKGIRQHGIRKENIRLQNELTEMLRQLQTKNNQLEESLELQQKLATTDHLTGLANRRSFAEQLERSYQEATRYGSDLTCCMLDLDHYKRLNDTLGHQVGDKVLIITAEVIRQSLRASDIAARYGGDEFVLLLPRTELEMGVWVAQRVQQQFMLQTAEYFQIAQLGVSVGAASLLSDHANSADHLLAMADKALYMAKDQGKGRIVTLHPCRIP